MGLQLSSYGLLFRQRASGWLGLLLALGLTAVGGVILSSASLSFLRRENYLFKQMAWLVLALAGFLLTALVPLEKMRQYLPVGTWLSGGLLLAVLVPGIGTRVNGSRRWLHCLVNIQVSECAKIALILWLADYMEKNAGLMDSFWRGFVRPVAFCALWAALIFAEPDYGSAVLLLSVAGTLLFLGGIRWRHLLLSAGAFGALFAGLVRHNPQRLRRIVAFLDLEGNRSDGAYQLWQAILAFASGGLGGRGLGHGRQQLVYLPEAHTDFIYAVLVEELGGFGGMTVLLLFMLFFLSLFFGLRRQESPFARLLGYGALLTIIYQSLLNLGVVTGCLPTKGIALPFISYGGSNLLTVYALLGLVLNALRQEFLSPAAGPAVPSSAGRCAGS